MELSINENYATSHSCSYLIEDSNWFYTSTILFSKNIPNTYKL